VLIHDPTTVRGESIAFGDPGEPCFGPWSDIFGIGDAVITEQASNAQFDGAVFIDELLSMADESSEFANTFGCEPHFGQVSRSCKVGEESGIGVIGFVGAAFHAMNIAGVGEFDGPARLLDEFIGEVGGAVACFDGDSFDLSELVCPFRDGEPVVVAAAVAEHFAVAIDDADLDEFLVVIQADED